MTDEERILMQAIMEELASRDVEEAEILTENSQDEIPEEFVDELEQTTTADSNLTTRNSTEITDVNEEAAEHVATEEELDESFMEEVSQVNENTTTNRFSGAVWFEKIKTLNVLVGGAGGIGSFLSFFLSRTNLNQITIYDDDVVEKANLAGQLYSVDHVGMKKVDGMAEIMRCFSEYNSYICIKERFVYDNNTTEQKATKIMMCGFDNMKARKDFFNAWLKLLNRHKEQYGNDVAKEFLFVDGRLNAEEFQVFTIRGNDTWAIDDYMKNKLFDDADAESEVCSYKQTTFCAAMIASMMVNSLVNFVTNLTGGVRSVPYFTYYDARSMLFTKQ